MNGKSAGYVLAMALLAYVAFRYYQSKHPTTAVAATNVANAGACACVLCVLNKQVRSGSPVDTPGVSLYCCIAAPQQKQQVQSFAQSNACQTTQVGYAAPLGPNENMPGCYPTACNAELA